MGHCSQGLWLAGNLNVVCQQRRRRELHKIKDRGVVREYKDLVVSGESKGIVALQHLKGL